MVQVNWTLQANEDLQNIALYISKDSKQYARMQVMRIRNRTKILHTHPHIGRKVAEYDEPNFKELIEGNYRIIYKIINDTTIDIVTIWHSARMLNM